MMRPALLVAAALASGASAGRGAPARRRAEESWRVTPVGSAAADCVLPNARPPPSARRFVSTVVDNYIATTVPKFKDPNLATLWSNALPNTLDTTVFAYRPSVPALNITPDTFVITGDITAMWLRDSTNQVYPYLPWAKADPGLGDMIRGVNWQAGAVHPPRPLRQRVPDGLVRGAGAAHG